jgi:hypothetical protein
MSKVIIEWVASLLRKVVFGASMAWLVNILKTAGASEAEIDRGIEIGLALAVMLVTAAWSAVRAWLAKRAAANAAQK